MIDLNDLSVNHLDGEFGLINKINNAMKEAADQFVYIGFLLKEADEYKYYEEAGYNNIYDFCEDTFGFGRSSTNNFIRVYRQFGSKNGIALLDSYKAYNYSQLTEMCSMNMNQLNECNPYMTVRELRAVKRGTSKLKREYTVEADEPQEVEVVKASVPSRQSGQNYNSNCLSVFIQVSKEFIINGCELFNIPLDDDWVNGIVTGLGERNDLFVDKMIDCFNHLKGSVILLSDFDFEDMGKCSNCGCLCAYEDNFCSDCGFRINKENLKGVNLNES